jgi:hypothetical protein
MPGPTVLPSLVACLSKVSDPRQRRGEPSCGPRKLPPRPERTAPRIAVLSPMAKNSVAKNAVANNRCSNWPPV